MLLVPWQGTTTTTGPEVARLRGQVICQQPLILRKKNNVVVKQDRQLTSRKSRGRLAPSPDKAVGSLVGGALQLDCEVLKFDLGVAGGGVIMAAHLHVVHDGRAAQRRVHQRLAHQPVCQVARTRHLQHRNAVVKSPSALLRLKTKISQSMCLAWQDSVTKAANDHVRPASCRKTAKIHELHKYHSLKKARCPASTNTTYLRSQGGQMWLATTAAKQKLLDSTSCEVCSVTPRRPYSTSSVTRGT